MVRSQPGRSSFDEGMKLLKVKYMKCTCRQRKTKKWRKLIESNPRYPLRGPLSAERALYIFCGLIYLRVSTNYGGCIYRSLRSISWIWGQNDPFIKKIITSSYLFKLVFKITSLVPHRRHIIKKYFFSSFKLKPQLANKTSFLNWSRSWQMKLHFWAEIAFGKWDFIF